MTTPRVVLSGPALAALSALGIDAFASGTPSHGDLLLNVEEVRDALSDGAVLPRETPPLFQEILEKIANIDGEFIACEEPEQEQEL